MTTENERLPRKRGRPPGKNRPAFTEDEKRARNAQLERERRGDIADATSELINQMNLEAKVNLAELLASTITYLKGEQSKEALRDLRATNQAMEAEIAKLKELIVSNSNKDKKIRKKEKSPTSSFKVTNLEGLKRTDSDNKENIIKQEPITPTKMKINDSFNATKSESFIASYTDDDKPFKKELTSPTKRTLKQDQEDVIEAQPAKKARLCLKRRASELPSTPTQAQVSLLLVSPKKVPSDEHENVPVTDHASDVGDILLSPDELREFQRIIAHRVVRNELPSWPPDDNFDLLLP